jgi:hypothetical protein
MSLGKRFPASPIPKKRNKLLQDLGWGQTCRQEEMETSYIGGPSLTSFLGPMAADMSDSPVNTSPALDAEPPISLDKFIEQSGFSAVTIWRYRRAGWLNTLNICGRHYLTRSEIARFNARAASGEFAQRPRRPKRGSV